MDNEGEVKCGKCKEIMPNKESGVTCSSCHQGFHYDCSIKEKSWRSLSREAKGKWECRSCRALKRTTSTSNEPVEEDTNDEDDITSKGDSQELSNLGISKTILEKVNCLLEMKDKLANIEKSVTFMAEKYDDLMNELKHIKDENVQLKKDVDILKKKDRENKEEIQSLSLNLAELDQYGLRCNLEIQGVRVEGDARNENIDQVVTDIAVKIGVDYKKEDIHRVHRLQTRKDSSKPPTILIQFFSTTVRDTWLNSGRKARLDKVFFNENLCQYYRALLKDTKDLAKMHNYSFVLFRGGKVMVRKREGDRSVIIIRNKDDLKKLVNG